MGLRQEPRAQEEPEPVEKRLEQVGDLPPVSYVLLILEPMPMHHRPMGASLGRPPLHDQRFLQIEWWWRRLQRFLH